MQEQILSLLLEQEDVTWKTIIQDLVKTEQMDPWDINITLLTHKYLAVIRKMQEHDLKVSGKVLLAAAFLLKMKSVHLIDNDFAHLDRLLNPEEESDEDIDTLLGSDRQRLKEPFQLIPRQPQPRSRKVSVNDLINALQQAMESKRRILARSKPVAYVMPKRGMDIMGVIRDMYHKIVYYSEKQNEEKLTFTKLLPPRAGKKEKVYTFIPLLHLEHQHRIETTQEKPFEEIEVKLLKGRTPAV